MISVFLIDDHEVVRRGIADLLGSEDDLTVVGEAGSVAEALVLVPAAAPDIAVIDVRLGDGSGVELCRELKSMMPEINCLMLTSFTDETAMVGAIMAGAGGYVIKDIKGFELVSAVRIVGSGHSMLDNRAAAMLMNSVRAPRPQSPLDALTGQERTLLGLIGEGLTNRQIAERMFLAEKTVKNYVSRLLAKLDLERRTQAAVLATELRVDGAGVEGPPRA